MDWARLFTPQPVSGINVQNGVMITGIIETVGFTEFRPTDDVPFIRLYLKIEADLFQNFISDDELQDGNIDIIQIIVYSHISGYKYLEYCSRRYINSGQTPAKGLQVTITHAQFNTRHNAYHCSEISRVQITKYKCNRCLNRTSYFYSKDLAKHESEVHKDDPVFMTHAMKLTKRLKLLGEVEDYYDRVFTENYDSDEECEDRAVRRMDSFDSFRPATIFHT